VEFPQVIAALLGHRNPPLSQCWQP